MYSSINRSLCRCYLRAVCKITYNLAKQCDRNIHGKTINLETDSLDNFTSQLIQRKTDKWSAQKATQKLTSETNINVTKDNNHEHNNNIEFLSIKRIDSLFQESIEANDNSTVMELIVQCIKFRKCPSLSNLIYVLTLCSHNGDKTTIIQIGELCEEFHPEVLRTNSHFRHYLAEAIWVKGNISESLNILKEVYRENAFLRRRIRLMYKYLIEDVVSNRSEAALVNIVKFAEDLLDNYRDFFPITCIWQTCFLSEWFTDQCLALDLLERNDGLCRAVISRIPYVVSVSLNNHRTEVVYRLLEILLKYDLNTQYGGVLLSLLDYQIRKGDLRSCNEIIQWSMENDVKLPTIHHTNFISLLLNYNMEISTSREKFLALKRGQLTSFKF